MAPPPQLFEPLQHKLTLDRTRAYALMVSHNSDESAESSAPSRLERQLASRPLFEPGGPYGKALVPFAVLFSWFMLAGWATNSLAQKMFVGAFVAFMWLVVLALLIPRRAKWAPRVVTAAVGVAYGWYLLAEAWDAFGAIAAGTKPTSEVLSALAGFALFGVPSNYAINGRFPWGAKSPTPSDVGGPSV